VIGGSNGARNWRISLPSKRRDVAFANIARVSSPRKKVARPYYLLKRCN